MKRFGLVMLVAVLCVALSAPAVLAAEKKATKGTSKKAPAAKKTNKPAAAEPKQVTQCELAQMLVQVLGLSRFLPASPSCMQCFGILMDNSVSPAEGWQPKEIVTKADLARVIVQAMKKQGDIKNPDDPKEWIDYLKSIGIPLDAVGETVSYVDPLAEPVAPNVLSAQVDPLTKRHKFNPLDETQYGVDMEYVARVLAEMERVAGEFFVIPVTPD